MDFDYVKQKRKEAHRLAARRHYLANREEILARAKLNHDPVKKAEYDRARRAAIADRLSAERREHRLQYGEIIRAQERARYASNPIARLSRNAARQSRVSGGSFTSQEWKDLLEEFDYRCAYCQAMGVALQIEHMTPLARGGLHAKSNIVPACASCNMKKHAKTLFEFAGAS